MVCRYLEVFFSVKSSCINISVLYLVRLFYAISTRYFYTFLVMIITKCPTVIGFVIAISPPQQGVS